MALVALALVLQLCWPAAAVAESRVFALKHRPASTLLAPVRALLGDEARVAAHGDTLSVRGSAADIAAVSELLASLDRPLRMLRISVAQGLDSRSSAQGVEASGQLRSGAATLVLGPSERRDSRLAPESDGSILWLSAEEGQRRERRGVEQSIAVLEGAEASIRVGQAIPYTTRLRSLCRKAGYCAEGVEYRKVDTGFVAHPEIYGDLVQLTITPFMAFPASDRAGQVVFQESSSKVRVPLGEWFDLGASVMARDELTREILAVRTDSLTSDGSIRLMVELQE